MTAAAAAPAPATAACSGERRMGGWLGTGFVTVGVGAGGAGVAIGAATVGSTGSTTAVGDSAATVGSIHLSAHLVRLAHLRRVERGPCLGAADSTGLSGSSGA